MDDLDPCLAYYDDENKLCAICKLNSIRIAVILDDGSKYMVCGSVRTPDRNEYGEYSFLDPDTVS